MKLLRFKWVVSKSCWAFFSFLILFATASNGQGCYTPVIRQTKMKWGANGHSLGQQAYANPTWEGDATPIATRLQKEIDLLKQFNLTYYRIGAGYRVVSGVENKIGKGLFNDSPFITETQFYGYITSVLSQLTSNGIQPLFVIAGNQGVDYPNFTSSDQSNYNNGYIQGQDIGTRYGSYVTYYELGNELDIPCGYPNRSGSTATDYDPAKITRTAAYLKGLNDGLKSKDADAKTIVDFGGWHHYGFFHALNAYSPTINNVTAPFNSFDLVGLHFYDSYTAANYNDAGMNKNGNLDFMNTTYNVPQNINMLAKLDGIYPNKDIWITEINTGSNYSYSNDWAQAKQYRVDWLRYNMTVANNYKGQNGTEKVKAFIVYELYDQLAFQNSESNLGLATCSDANCTTATAKPDLLTGLKSKMYELDNDYLPFVQALSITLSCGIQDQAGQNYWTNRFRTESDKKGVILNLLYNGWLDQFVRMAYQQIFDRPVDGAGLNDGLAALRGNALGYHPENFLSDKFMSNEFWNAAQQCSGTTAPCAATSNPAVNYNTITQTQVQNFVKRFYRKALGREVDGSGLAFHTNNIYNAPAGTRATAQRTMVDNILKSKEYIDAFVTNQYYSLLGDVTFGYQNFGTYYHNQLLNGTMKQRDVVADILCTSQFWNKAMNRAYYATPPNTGTITTNPVLLNYLTQAPGSWFSPYAAPTSKPTYTYYINNKQCVVKRPDGTVLRKEEPGLAANLSANEMAASVSAFTVYPNPTEGIIRITPNGANLSEVQQIELLSLSGEVQKDVLFQVNKTEMTADLSSLKKGIYMIRIHTSNGKYLQKIVR